MDNLLLCSGCGKMDATGISIHFPLQLEVVGISPSSKCDGKIIRVFGVLSNHKGKTGILLMSIAYSI